MNIVKRSKPGKWSLLALLISCVFMMTATKCRVEDPVHVEDILVDDRHRSDRTDIADGGETSFQAPIYVLRDNPRFYGWIPGADISLSGSKDEYDLFNQYKHVNWIWETTPDKVPRLITRFHAVVDTTIYSHTSKLNLMLPEHYASGSGIQIWSHRGIRVNKNMLARVQSWYPGRETKPHKVHVTIDPMVMVVPVAIISFTTRNMDYDFGPAAEALIDFMPSPWQPWGATEFPLSGTLPDATAMGIPPDDIWGRCEKPIQFQSVGHWTIPFDPQWWETMNMCGADPGHNWLPGLDDGLLEMIKKEYMDQGTDVVEYIQKVFGSKGNGGLTPLLIRIGPSRHDCPPADGHTGIDGIDIITVHINDAIKGNTVAHELGHFLGLDHKYIDGNIMHEFNDRNWTGIDNEQCSTVYHNAKQWDTHYSEWLGKLLISGGWNKWKVK